MPKRACLADHSETYRYWPELEELLTAFLGPVVIAGISV